MNNLALSLLPPDQLSVLLSASQATLQQRIRENQLKYYRPYPKQAEFHAHGLKYRERLFMAGNQLGKTLAGGFEAALHATGRYPDWWTGRRFDKPTVSWVAGVTGESTRDNVQRILLGRLGAEGTGAIPKVDLVDVITGRGVPGLADTVMVRHVSGGESSIGFKSYEKGREKWQGETLDFVWFDEEPPADIYSEGLTRTQATRGLVYMTFTPLLGMSDVVSMFLKEPSEDRIVINMTIDDAAHYTSEEKRRIIASYPAHEREARAKGIPMLGSGRIFPIAEDYITISPIPIPAYWVQIGGLDFGWDHPTAAVKLAWDRDLDTVFVTAEYRVKEATPILHAASLRPWGNTLPWAWPHDGNNDTAAGENLREQYRKQGLAMLGERATYSDGSNSVEAGLMEMLDRMQTNRWKVFSNCPLWFEEFRGYHRKDGKVVKERDDLMSASRYAMMMLRYARPLVKRKPLIVQGSSGYDPHSMSYTG